MKPIGVWAPSVYYWQHDPDDVYAPPRERSDGQPGRRSPYIYYYAWCDRQIAGKQKADLCGRNDFIADLRNFTRDTQTETACGRSANREHTTEAVNT